METLKNQVDALTGFAGTEDLALGDWLTSGARLVLNALPISKLHRIVDSSSFDDNGLDVEGHRIVGVTRSDGTVQQPAREVPAAMRGRIIDPSFMEFATATDPAYYLDNKLLYVLPAMSATNGRLSSVKTSIEVAVSATSIDNFPDEAESAVVLYAARNALARQIQSKNADEDPELVSSFMAQYQIIDAQYKEALQVLGIERIYVEDTRMESK